MNRRRRRPRPAAEDAKVRQSLAEELMSVCAECLRGYGLGTAALRRAAQRAVDGPVRSRSGAGIYEQVVALGKLAAEWSDNARYADKQGRPRVLRIHGPAPSLAALCRRYFAGQSVERVLRFAARAQVLERTDRAHVAPLGNCVILAANPTLLLAHAVRSMRWFLSSIRHNHASIGRRTAVWPERQAFVELDARAFPQFVQVMREPLHNLIDMGHRWLQGRSGRSGRAHGRRTTVGVQAFVFRDRPTRARRV